VLLQPLLLRRTALLLTAKSAGTLLIWRSASAAAWLSFHTHTATTAASHCSCEPWQHQE
jgi:hypothetical protein